MLGGYPDTNAQIALAQKGPGVVILQYDKNGEGNDFDMPRRR